MRICCQLCLGWEGIERENEENGWHCLVALASSLVHVLSWALLLSLHRLHFRRRRHSFYALGQARTAAAMLRFKLLNCRLSLASSMQKKPLRRRWGKGSRQCLRHCGGTVEATLEPFDCLTTWLFECQMKLQLAMATRQSNNKGAAETRTQLKAARYHRDTHHATPQHSKDTRCQHYTTQHSKAQA